MTNKEQYSLDYLGSHHFKQIVDKLFEEASEKANRRIMRGSSGAVLKDGGYKCIHLDIYEFIEAIQNVIRILKIKETEKVKFLDVGCGVGQKVYLAKTIFGLDSYGLELREELRKEGKKVFDSLLYTDSRILDNTFIAGNALTFRNYNEFDIIYFYCPLYNPELEIKMEKKICRDAKSGAIVIPFNGRLFLRWESHKTDVEKNGWIKKGSYEDGFFYQKK